MTLGTVIYLVLLLAGLIISVTSLSYGTVALVGALVLLPIVMIGFLVSMRIHTSVDVTCRNTVAEKDDIEKPARATMALSVENRGWLPIGKGIVWVRYENQFSGEKGKLKIRFSVDAGKTRGRRIPVVIRHCGNVTIQVEKVKIYDYLNIFAFRIRKNFEAQDILVLPPTKDIYLGKDRWYNQTNEDSDRYSLYKKGDDPSEIFDIREFKDGDRYQQIHWKLSSKTGQLMVKEGSLPLSRAVHVFIDLSAQTPEDLDLLVQGLYSVAMEFIMQGVPQYYIWYDVENDLIQEQYVEQEEELFWMLEDFFKCKATKEEGQLIHAYMEWESGKPKESGLYLTVSDHVQTDFDALEVKELLILDLRKEE